MAVRTTVAEALEVWREAERLLEELPPLSPDHETVAVIAAESRDLYQRLTNDADLTANVLARSHQRIGEAQALLRALRHPARG